MESVEVSFSKTLIWPDRCAYCNEPAQSFAESKHSTISGINPFFYTRQFLTLKYPVCNRHRLLGRFHGFLSHQSFVDLFVGFLFIPVLVALPTLAITGMNDGGTMPLLAILYTAYPVAALILKSRMPIRVIKYDKQTMVIGISNETFGRTFRTLNG